MRLIDADKIDFTHEIDPFEIPGAQYSVAQVPTVEAIPVEWIEEKARMYDDLAEHVGGMWGEIYSEWADMLRQLVEKWRERK